MTDYPPILILRLEGPMQSWGLKAKWDIRDTGEEPSKSGIVGLIGCAMGYSRNDPRLVEELDKNLRIGIRIENPGEISKDFHTINGVLPTAEGKFKGSDGEPTTIISIREYIEDASFLVAIEGPGQLLYKIRDAMEDPRWPIYLGRKSCPPTRPIFETITQDYGSIDDVLAKYPWSSYTCEVREKYPEELKCIVEDHNGPYMRTDRVQKSPVRMYGIRNVRIFKIKAPIMKEDTCTSLD
ncbi:type I-E CRISPR-associated protein Cas5/CasD [Methanooceanicella nereidis]|nr:type I-E CRISPR-associated protein Cas5/CasD [Methanocella sp. CWC-04]